MKTVRLGQIAESLPCDYGDDPTDAAAVADVVKVSNIDGEGHLHGTLEKRAFRPERLSSLLVGEGELLVVKSSGSKANVLSGKTAICDASLAGRIVASNFLLRLRPDRSAVEPRYLWRVLNSPASKAFVKTIVAAFTYPNLNWSQYLAHPIPLPPLAEQQRIAKVLDRAEALRAKRRATIAELDALAEAIFHDLFRAPEAQDWPELPIASLAAAKPNAIRTGPFGSQLLHSEFVESGIAVLGIDNVVQNEFVWARPRFITDKKYRQLQRYMVFPGDVLITIMGTCGRCAIVPEGIPDAINTKHLCCITVDQTRCLPVYLQACFLLHPKVQHRLGVRERGAVMPGLNMQIIKELRVPLPPLTIQREFIQRVEMVKNLKASQRASLGELDGLFASLQHRAFRGEL